MPGIPALALVGERLGLGAGGVLFALGAFLAGAIGGLLHPATLTWQAVAALATFAAVVVALFPIFRESRRRKAKARTFRLRMRARLGTLRPSLGKAIQGQARYPGAVLTQEEFRRAVRGISEMMRESDVLEPREQDYLGAAISNLEMTAVTYGTDDLYPKSAHNVIRLIDQAIDVMREHGLFHGEVDVPWKDRGSESNGPESAG